MDNTVGWEEWFDLDLRTCDRKINWDHQLIEGNPCTNFGFDQVKGSKDIERTTQCAEKSGLTLTFEHVTWKSIGIIYSLRATPAPSLVLIKGRGQKTLSEQHLVYRPTDRPTDRPTVAKQYVPFFKRGGGIKTLRKKYLGLIFSDKKSRLDERSCIISFNIYEMNTLFFLCLLLRMCINL